MGDDNSLDGALREAFGEPEGESIISRLGRLSGVRSRILLHDASGEESPLLRVPTSRSEQGALHDDRYQVVGEIARGGVGVVYKARDTDLGRDVALKVLRMEHADRPEVLERLVEEAQIGGQLQHPGIVPVYSIGLQGDGRPHIAMKLIKGKTLASILKARKDPAAELPRLLRIFEQACQTMAYAHSRGVIHRDLKPANIMVGSFGEVQVVDWGFGKVLGHNDPMAERLRERTIVATVRSAGEGSQSMVGSVMGTPAYMPPEQALGQIDDLDERCDVFALGAILCEILTGKPPYVGDIRDLLTMAAQGRLEDANQRLDTCVADPALITLCRKALSPLRLDRHENAAEVAAVIEGHLAAADQRARDAEVRVIREHSALEREQEAAAWARRSKNKTRTLAAVVLSAILLAGTAWYWTSAERRIRADELRTSAQSALAEAERHIGAGRWTEAVAKATAARDLAAQSGLLASLESDAASLADRATTGAERVRRRDQLLRGIEGARMHRATSFDQIATDDRYLAVFADAGLDFSGARAEELAARIETEYGEAIGNIAAALDDWAWLRRAKPELRERSSDPILEVARRIDSHTESNRLRDAIAHSDAEVLESLAEDALERGLSARALDLLGTALWASDRREAGAAYYAKLRTRFPGDFWIQHHSAAFARDPTQRLARATAAAALLPGSAFARTQLGVAYSLSGDEATAVTYYRQAIELDAAYAEAHNCLGVALLSQRDLAGAVAAYREAIRLGPVRSYFHSNLATALGRAGDMDGAVAAARAWIRHSPADPAAHYNLGAYLEKQNDVAGAEAAYRETLRLSPVLVEAHVNLSILLFQAGRLDDAIAILREAVHARPDFAKAWDNLGYCLEQKGQSDEAISNYREALRRDPGYLNPYMHLGAALSKKGDSDGAIATYREGIKHMPGVSQLHVNLGNALHRRGDLPGALRAAKESIRLNPSDPLARSNLGTYLVALGELDTAMAAYREAIRLKPDFVAAHVNLARVLLTRGDVEGVVQSTRKAIEFDPSNFAAYLHLGIAHARQRDFKRAKRAFRKAIEMNPKSHVAHMNLGLALLSKGDTDGAIASFRETTRLQPTDASGHHNLSVALRKKGDWDGALDSAREAIRRGPRMAIARFNLGNILKSKRAWREALDAYKEAHKLSEEHPEGRMSAQEAIDELKALIERQEGK